MYIKFKRLLKRYKTTSYAVAKATGISESTFSNWKHGNSTPKADKLVRLADYFGVPIDYFLK